MDLMQYLQEKYPEMKPVTKPPGMYTLNGIGTMLYGSRDVDPESGTYIKTLCLTVIFVPVFNLSAYVVADNTEGWCFFGKVPLSASARRWNWLALVSILLVAGLTLYTHHANHPDTIAAQRLAQGDQWTAAGKLGQAARLYQDMTLQGGAHASAALARLGGLLDGAIDQAGSEDLLEVYGAAVDVYKLKQEPAQVFAKGLSQARRRRKDSPADALRLLAVIAPLSPQSAELLELKQPLLEERPAREPGDLDAVSELAIVYETRKDLKKCEELLTPHEAQLGSREGARILGQIYVNQGKFDLALALLQGYAEERLKTLQVTEQGLNNTVKRIHDAAFARLRRGVAVPGFDIAHYQRSNEATQAAMVRDYLDNELRNHPDFKRAQEALRDQSRVVPVALDLRIVLLRRAQAQNDPEARARELEKAEKTFLAIRSLAGQDDQFRIFLGQVYYWMGKHAEGRKLFDDYLADKDRQGRSLLMVAQILREIVSVADVRSLAEEAYQNEIDPPHKYLAAGFRATMNKDLDDRIEWLNKGDPNDRYNKAELSAALGDKALSENREEDAGRYLRAAIEHYDALPESAATLNNSALAHAALFRLTGERRHLEKGFANLDKAANLSPRDSILLRNVADALLANALADVIGNAIDLKTLRQTGSLEALGYLGRDQAEEKSWVAKVRRHEGIARARFHFERVLTLSPKNAPLYGTLAALLEYVQDKDALAALVKRAREADFDQADMVRQAKELLEGKNDDKFRRDLRNAADYQEKIAREAQKIGGPTLAMALGALSLTRFSQEIFDPSFSSADLVQLAENAHQAAPSKTTAANLVRAYLVRAHHDLKKQEPVYAALAEKCRRSLSAGSLIALLMTMDGPAKNLCRENPDVRKVQKMLLAEAETFPDRASEWRWAMLQGAHPQLGDKMAQIIKKDAMLPLTRELAEILSPLNAVSACRDYWNHLMRGERDKAQAVLERYADKGVPLPLPGR